MIYGRTNGIEMKSRKTKISLNFVECCVQRLVHFVRRKMTVGYSYVEQITEAKTALELLNTRRHTAFTNRLQEVNYYEAFNEISSFICQLVRSFADLTLLFLSSSQHLTCAQNYV